MSPRPLPVTVAAILLALFSVLNLWFPLWAESIPREEEVPALVVYTTVLVGVAGLLGTASLWMLRKWSLWLTIVVSVLNVLDGAAGVGGAPNAALQVAATVMVVGFALIIVLVVLPTSRCALAAAEQPSRVR
ncbi:MAG TPA: hypothetical protein VI027_11355 [Rubrobacteraceae bacterium]